MKRGCRYYQNLIVFSFGAIIVGMLFLVYVGHPFFLSRGWVKPQRASLGGIIPHGPYEDVAFQTQDGLTIRSWYILPENGAVIILAHPLASNRVGMLPVAEMLARHGYGSLLIDIRAHGESEGDKVTYGGSLGDEVAAAAAYLKGRDEVDAIGTLGWSLGAQVSLYGAVKSNLIQAAVSDAPCCVTFGDWPPATHLGEVLYVPYDLVFFQFLKLHSGVSDPMSVREAFRAMGSRPVLLIGSKREERANQHLLGEQPPPRAQLWTYPGEGHLMGLENAEEAYSQTVIGFFDTHLLNQE